MEPDAKKARLEATNQAVPFLGQIQGCQMMPACMQDSPNGQE